MQLLVHLPGLKPKGVANKPYPPATFLIGRFVYVAAHAKQWLMPSDEIQERRRANSLSVSADIHTQGRWRLVNEPRALAQFVWLELRQKR